MTLPDRVYTVTGWYDGPREGIADYRGAPHSYASQFTNISSDSEDVFVLRPVDKQTLALALEDWEIWLRWEAAFHAGRTTAETHPALPADRLRHDEIAPQLQARLEARGGAPQHAHGRFQQETAGAPLTVQWTLAEAPPPTAS